MSSSDPWSENVVGKINNGTCFFYIHSYSISFISALGLAFYCSGYSCKTIYKGKRQKSDMYHK